MGGRERERNAETRKEEKKRKKKGDGRRAAELVEWQKEKKGPGVSAKRELVLTGKKRVTRGREEVDGK